MTETNIKHVRDAWAFLRKNNMDITDHILDLMRDAAIEKISHSERIKDLKCPNCGSESIYGIVHIQNGIEVPRLIAQSGNKKEYTSMTFQCCTCGFEWVDKGGN